MLERVIAIAQSAGHVIEGIRRKGFDVQHKGKQGPVTAVFGELRLAFRGDGR
jgi:hypothetical protein